MNEDLFGRQLTATQLPPTFEPTDPRIVSRPAMTISGRWVRCERCHQQFEKVHVALPAGGYYCPDCLALGRITSRQSLLTIPEPNAFPSQTNTLTWVGSLTRLQQICAQDVQNVFVKRQRHLLWAVTGAGKTEMLFLGLADALKRGDRVAVASPRVDVCIELFPRFQQAFKNTPMVLLHGQQTEPYRYCQFTVCTTHQLLRFYHAFDVLVVDEVDAFPFAQNKQLMFAVDQAIKPNGACLYLTATPGTELMHAVTRRQLTMSYLPLRFHGHLLPEIQCRGAWHWREKLRHGRLPAGLQVAVTTRLRQHKRFLLFVPHVAQLSDVAAAIRHFAPRASFVTVHAADGERVEKVAAMRQKKVDFLVTTTILERGVTFPDIDVFVLGADDAVFSAAALVQIAGRAGRNAAAPDGKVIYWIEQTTLTLRRAIRQIQVVNQKGRRLPEWRHV
ncbi:DEAD/DEAH box helicase [Furfurilactobacillus milii]|uniref:DEAD/DEAH box helicase n=1 Tax=Furfurilactobacillus milii TaxID=2888272 RepID=A0A6N9I7N5_9LACO|nr:DEAD/DEAH box helicase [Furfurilactobacillus milii]MYV18303.1 DEAD/DEAH box helicase [Furfurilactobacillus milii]